MRYSCFLNLFYFCLFSAIIFNAKNSLAQDSTLRYNAAVLLAGSTGKTPFWIRANQNATIPLNGNFVSGHWGIYKIYNNNNPRIFQWSGGAEVVTNYEQSGKVIFTDLYIAGKIGPIEFLAGQKKGVMGLMDTTLTSGSLSFSGNARPFPQIKISVPRFFPLAFTNYLVSLKFSYSDGLLGGSDINYGSIHHVPLTYLHQKSLYFKVGMPNNNLNIYAGINHQVIWGGENKISPSYDLISSKAYWHAITGKTFNYRKIGDHFGTIDLGTEWKNSNWSYFLYRQNIYETGSLFQLTHFQDGLNGLRIKRNKVASNQKYTNFIIRSLLFEFINTKNQINNSPLSGLAIFEKGNYFNSYIYSNGWAYRGRGLGTPLITEKNLSDKNLPEVATQFTNNNRITTFHTGFEATWLNTSLTFKGTYSSNFGTYLRPFNNNKKQLSVLITAEKNIKKWNNLSFITSISSDSGSLYPNSMGILVGIRKNGFLN